MNNEKELLEEYRRLTPQMTKEKYNYLKENSMLSPIKAVQLKYLQSKTQSEELKIRAEYQARFESYANSWYRTWEKEKWGTRENESLYEFADSALNKTIKELEEKKETRTGR